MAVVRVRRAYVVAFLLLIAAVVLPTVVRSLLQDGGPSLVIATSDGTTRSISLAEMKRMSSIVRRGAYQNQYGNWRDEGEYEGVRLSDLLGESEVYASIRVVAEDGYEMTIERERVESEAFPMVLAYALDGTEVPAWLDGFRIAVLPESGSVGNAEYGAESAGSYWVRNVARIILQGVPHNSSTR